MEHPVRSSRKLPDRRMAVNSAVVSSRLFALLLARRARRLCEITENGLSYVVQSRRRSCVAMLSPDICANLQEGELPHRAIGAWLSI
jgi:hypothetical protein